MTVWSHNKRRSIKKDISEQDRIGGVGKLFIPYALDGFRRTRCKDCSCIFYTEKMTRYVYKARHRSVGICPKCDPIERSWKRIGTDEDERVYKDRCKAHGITIRQVATNNN